MLHCACRTTSKVQCLQFFVIDHLLVRLLRCRGRIVCDADVVWVGLSSLRLEAFLLQLAAVIVIIWFRIAETLVLWSNIVKYKGSGVQWSIYPSIRSSPDQVEFWALSFRSFTRVVVYKYHCRCWVSLFVIQFYGPASSSSTVYVIVHVSGTKVEVTKLYTLNLEISHFKSTPNIKQCLVLTSSLLNCLSNV